MIKIEPFWKIFGIVLSCTILVAVLIVGFIWSMNTITYAFGFWYAVGFMIVFWSFFVACMAYVTQYGMIKEEDK